MYLTFAVIEHHLLLAPERILQMPAHELVRYENQPVAWQTLTNSEIIAEFRAARMKEAAAKIKEANNRFYDSPSDAQFLLPSEWMLKV